MARWHSKTYFTVKIVKRDFGAKASTLKKSMIQVMDASSV